jgi:hypothetical protein
MPACFFLLGARKTFAWYKLQMILANIKKRTCGQFEERKKTVNDLCHCGVQQPDWAAEPNTGRPGQEHQDREGGRTAGQSTIYNYITSQSLSVTHNFDRDGGGGGSQK